MLDVKLKLRPGHVKDSDWMKSLNVYRMGWNATCACNYSCDVCYSSSGKRAPDELSTAEAKDMMLQAKDLGVERFIVSGGEPFARPDMIELLSYMGSLGIDALIATNGSLLTRDMVKRMRDETLAKSIQVSLDTLDREQYARFHGAPAEMLDRALLSLDYIQEAGFHTTISTCPTPMILSGIPDLLDLAQQKRWPTVTVHCTMPVGRSQDDWPADTDILSRLQPAFEHFLSMSEHWCVQISIPWARYHPVIQRLSERIRVAHKGCSGGRDCLMVDANGDFYPFVCMMREELRMGNVRERRMADMCRESSFLELMRRPWDHGICTDCEYVKECGGGCRSRAIAEGGRVDALDMSCPVRKAIAQKHDLANA